MNSIWAIARYTIIEQIRNRLYLIVLFFGALVLSSSILLGALAPGHKMRVIFDLGLVALEIFGLVTAVFGSVSLILQEMESKTIYLILILKLNFMAGMNFENRRDFLGKLTGTAAILSAGSFLNPAEGPVKKRDFRSQSAF